MLIDCKGTSCGYWLNATSDDPVLMSGFQVDYPTNESTNGEALLLRMLPLNTPVSLSTRLSGQLFNGSVYFKDIYAPFLDALIVSSADGTADSVYKQTPPVAQECILAWCVKTLKSSYSSGGYQETVVATFLNSTGRANPTPWSSTEIDFNGDKANWVIFGGNYSIHPSSEETPVIEYGVSNETFSRTQALFEDVFPSTITVANRTAQPWWKIKALRWEANYLRAFTYCAWLAPNNVTAYMEEFATAMTNNVRSHKSSEYFSGRAYTQTTFIAVHWEWLIFPLALLFLSLAFLIATMLKTSKGMSEGLEVWKTSAMPTLVYSLPRDVQRDLKESSEGENGGTKKVKIRLSPGQGWKVSGHNLLSPSKSRRLNHQPPPGWI